MLRVWRRIFELIWHISGNQPTWGWLTNLSIRFEVARTLIMFLSHANPIHTASKIGSQSITVVFVSIVAFSGVENLQKRHTILGCQNSCRRIPWWLRIRILGPWKSLEGLVERNQHALLACRANRPSGIFKNRLCKNMSKGEVRSEYGTVGVNPFMSTCSRNNEKNTCLVSTVFDGSTISTKTNTLVADDTEEQQSTLVTTKINRSKSHQQYSDLMGFVDDCDREILYALPQLKKYHRTTAHMMQIFTLTVQVDSKRVFTSAVHQQPHTCRNGKNWRKMAFVRPLNAKIQRNTPSKKVQRVFDEIVSVVMSYMANNDKQPSFVGFVVRYANSVIRKVTSVIWRAKMNKRCVCIFHIF